MSNEMNNGLEPQVTEAPKLSVVEKLVNDLKADDKVTLIAFLDARSRLIRARDDLSRHQRDVEADERKVNDALIAFGKAKDAVKGFWEGVS